MPMAALYVFLGAFVYAVVYTVWLKRRSWTNIVIGGLAGSFAVLAGGAAVDPALGPLPALLALVLFLWTPPHFWSLAIAYHAEYSAAGVPMLPVVVGPQRAARIVFASTAALVGASLLPGLFGAGPVYMAGCAGRRPVLPAQGACAGARAEPQGGDGVVLRVAAAVEPAARCGHHRRPDALVVLNRFGSSYRRAHRHVSDPPNAPRRPWRAGPDPLPGRCSAADAAGAVLVVGGARRRGPAAARGHAAGSTAGRRGRTGAQRPGTADAERRSRTARQPGGDRSPARRPRAARWPGPAGAAVKLPRQAAAGEFHLHRLLPGLPDQHPVVAGVAQTLAQGVRRAAFQRHQHRLQPAGRFAAGDARVRRAAPHCRAELGVSSARRPRPWTR